MGDGIPSNSKYDCWQTKTRTDRQTSHCRETDSVQHRQTRRDTQTQTERQTESQSDTRFQFTAAATHVGFMRHFYYKYADRINVKYVAEIWYRIA